jgi:hypothetical protein
VKLRKLSLLLLFSVAAAGVATATPILSPVVYTFASISPDPFASPTTYASWSANALAALQAPASTYGTTGQPDYYSEISSFTPYQIIGTGPYLSDPGFSSWEGQINPTGAYFGQTGNALVFPMAVYGNGTTFTPSDVTFSDDFYDTLSGTLFLSDYLDPADQFRTIGIYCSDYPICATPTIYGGTTGNLLTASTTLNELFFSGFATSFSVANLSDWGSSLDQIGGAPVKTTAGAATLQIGATKYTSTATPLVVPEPATAWLSGIGLIVAGLAARKIRKVA